MQKNHINIHGLNIWNKLNTCFEYNLKKNPDTLNACSKVGMLYIFQLKQCIFKCIPNNGRVSKKGHNSGKYSETALIWKTIHRKCV